MNLSRWLFDTRIPSRESVLIFREALGNIIGPASATHFDCGVNR